MAGGPRRYWRTGLRMCSVQRRISQFSYSDEGRNSSPLIKRTSLPRPRRGGRPRSRGQVSWGSLGDADAPLTMKILSFLRHPASWIVLLPLLAVLYLWLGWRAFILMLGCAFAGDLVQWSLLLLTAGAVGGFVLSLLPSVVWPRSRFVWAFCYAAVTLIFGLASIGEVRSAKGPWPFLVWSGCGFAILFAGWYGGVCGKRLAARYQSRQAPT